MYSISRDYSFKGIGSPQGGAQLKNFKSTEI